MAPVSNPLKAAASTSSDHERKSAKKSRLNDDYADEGSPESETLSVNIKTENEGNYEEEKKYDDKDINGRCESPSSGHRNVGKSMKLNIIHSIKSFKANYERETDPAVIARREKQIEYGKNTPEYSNYLEAVPKLTRQSFMPKTPNKYRKYSRRAWDGLIRQWRLNLHCWSDLPLEDLAAHGESKHDDSFCSEDTNISTSTSSSLADPFTFGLGLASSSKEDIKSVSRCGSVSFPEFGEDVDMKGNVEDTKPNVEDVDMKPNVDEVKVELALLEKNTKETDTDMSVADIKKELDSHESVLAKVESGVKGREAQLKSEVDVPNTSWADEVDEYLAEEGLMP